MFKIYSRLSYLFTYLLYVFLEALLEHLVSLVQDDGLEVIELEVSSVDVVKDSACCADEKVNSTFQLSGLVFNRDTTVNCEHSVLVFSVLQLVKLCRDLNINHSLFLLEGQALLLGRETWPRCAASQGTCSCEGTPRWAKRSPKSYQSQLDHDRSSLLC